MTVGVNVRIDISRIQGAGRGVFATQDMKMNQLITKYEGRVVPNNHVLNDEEHAYAINCDKHNTLVGYSDRRNWHGYGAASLINDALCPALQRKTIRAQPVTRSLQKTHDTQYGAINCFLHAERGSQLLHAYACKDIKAGDELYTTYRWTYWKHRFRRNRLRSMHARMHEISEDAMNDYGTFCEIPMSCRHHDALFEKTLQVRWVRYGPKNTKNACPCDRYGKCLGAKEYVTVYDILKKKLTIFCQDCHGSKQRFV